MAKDNDTHQFIRNSLRSIYLGDQSVKHAYWIGVSRDILLVPFSYVDGDPLREDFQPWGKNVDKSNYCVVMPNDDIIDFDWKDMDPNPFGLVWYNGWSFFPLCEIYI